MTRPLLSAALLLAQLAAVLTLADITLRHPNLAVAGSAGWLAAFGGGAALKARWRA